MSFDPALFAKVGRSITRQRNIDKEARTRTAIGRAYYALFLAIRTAIWTQEGRETHGRENRIEHGVLKNSLDSAASDDLNILAKLLGELYDARRQADYVLEPSAHWAKYCEKPMNAERLLKRVEATIRRLPTMDFTEMIGKN